MTEKQIEQVKAQLSEGETVNRMYRAYEGDGIKLLDWLAERGTAYSVKLHTMNPVGRENMQSLIDRYW